MFIELCHPGQGLADAGETYIAPKHDHGFKKRRGVFAAADGGLDSLQYKAGSRKPNFGFLKNEPLHLYMTLHGKARGFEELADRHNRNPFIAANPQ